MTPSTVPSDVRVDGRHQRRAFVAVALISLIATLALTPACKNEDGARRNRRAKPATASENHQPSPKPAKKPAPTSPKPTPDTPKPVPDTQPAVDGTTGHTERPRDAGAASCGAPQPWDRDGDGISDDIEQSNARLGRRLAHTQCDQDLSRALGQPANGRLAEGINLPDRGSGYVHVRGSDPVDSDDWGTLRLVSCLESVGRRWQPTGLAINVTDLSLRPGGLFRPHSSHQNGLDVDVRYPRADGRSAPLDIRLQPDAYDPVAARELIDAFIALCPVHVVFTDLDSLQFQNEDVAMPLLVTARGHTNHFHVRLKAAAP